MRLTSTYRGVITGLLMIGISVLFFYGLHWPVKGYNHFAAQAIYVVGILWSLIAFKINAGAERTTKEYFSEGFKTFIVATLLMVLYTVIFYKLNPQILEKMLTENAVLAAKEGNYTPADIEANSNKLRSIFMPMTIAITTLIHLVLGAIVSVIGGVILRQQK